MARSMAEKSKTEPSFQAFQRAFTQHIRNPKTVARPTKVPAKRMAVYTEIVYNNIEGTFATCFPVTKSLLSARKWQALVRSFMVDYRASTPIFREIPQQFLQHLQTANLSVLKLPAFLPSLMHYEWVELLVSTMEDTIVGDANNMLSISPNGNLLTHQPAFTPTMQLLHYEYAVHQISHQYQPKNKTHTQLLVYRDSTFTVKFIEINAVTYELLFQLQKESITCEQALTMTASKYSQVSIEHMMQFGLQILTALKEQGVILGVYSKLTKEA